ncbi:ribonuclease T2 family protein [Imhoffiella purpurea]|nr:ribonuclease I [Imhoffiella purpurea]
MFAIALLTLAMSPSAIAQEVRLHGRFTALASCEATKKKDADNPGNIRLEAGTTYAMIGRNATPGTHYRIRVPGAPVTEDRWVRMSCGTYVSDMDRDATLTPSLPAAGPDPAPIGLAPDSIEFVLAASWQPAFCASARGASKPECRSQTPDRFDATHFSLHGLWPDDLDDFAIFPCYCDRGGPIGCRGKQGPDARIAISPEVESRLEIAMPGMRSDLHLHEWSKHGSCYEDDKSGPDAGADPDEYFTESMAVLDALNGSGVRRLFADSLGEILTRDRILAAFDAAFGQGAGQRVLIRCTRVDGENLVSELWINLKGDIDTPADLGSLIQAAPPISRSTHEVGCASGRVREVR